MLQVTSYKQVSTNTIKENNPTTLHIPGRDIGLYIFLLLAVGRENSVNGSQNQPRKPLLTAKKWH